MVFAPQPVYIELKLVIGISVCQLKTALLSVMVIALILVLMDTTFLIITIVLNVSSYLLFPAITIQKCLYV